MKIQFLLFQYLYRSSINTAIFSSNKISRLSDSTISTIFSFSIRYSSSSTPSPPKDYRRNNISCYFNGDGDSSIYSSIVWISGIIHQIILKLTYNFLQNPNDTLLISFGFLLQQAFKSIRNITQDIIYVHLKV